MPPRDASVRRAQLMFAAGAAIVALGVIAVVLLIPHAVGQEVTSDDFLQDWLSARAHATGADPYAPLHDLFDRELPGEDPGDQVHQPNPHPPALLLLYRPLAAFGLATARVVWLLFSAAIFVASVAAVVRSLGHSQRAAFVAGVGSLAIPVVQKDLLWGQSNSLLLASVVIAWLALRNDKQGLAGGALGFAAALKFFPLLLIIPLIRMGARHALAWMAATFAIVSGLGVLSFGWRASFDFATTISRSNTEFWAGAPMNQSLTAVPLRWLRDGFWYDQGPDLPLIASIMAFAIMVALAAVAWRSNGNLTGDLLLAAVPVMLLASPLTWEFSITLMLPTIIVVASNRWRARGLPSITVLVAMFVLMMGVPPGLPIPDGASPLVQLLGYGLPSYALIVIAGVEGWGVGHSSLTRSSTSDSSTIPPTGSKR